MLAWNLFTLVCLFGAGALALLWLRELGLSRFAAAAGGLVYEIAPYRLVQSRGHLLGPISLLLPLALWAFERARKTGDQRWWWASRAALVSIPLSGQVHLALGAIPFYVLYGICRSREARVVFETVLGAVAAVLAGVLIDQTVINGSIDEGGRSLKEVNVYSATGIDFVSRHVGGNAEAFVFLGWLTPLLAVGGLHPARAAATGGSRAGWGSARSSRSCSPSGRTTPCTARSGTPSRRFATRASPSA